MYVPCEEQLLPEVCPVMPDCVSCKRTDEHLIDLKRFVLIVLMVILWSALVAQRPAYSVQDIPVVLQKLKTMPDDSSKIWYILAAAQLYMLKDGELRSDLDSAVLMLDEADRLNRSYSIEKYQLKSRLYRCLVYMEDQQWAEGRKIIRELDERYTQNGDKYNHAIALNRYAMYLNPAALEFADEKRTLLLRASKLFGETGSRKRQLNADLMLADQHIYLGQTDSALIKVTPILREYLETDNADVLRAYGVMMEIHRTYGNNDEVLRYALEALAYCEKKGQKVWSYSLYTQLGDAYSALQNYKKTEEWYRLYLDESRANFKGRVYYRLHHLINAMLQNGKVDEAHELMTDLVAEFSTEDPVVLERIGFCWGRIYEHQKKFALAEKNYRIAVSTLSGLDDPSFRDAISKFYFSQQQYMEAKRHAETVFEYTEVPLLTKSTAYLNLYRADSALGNYRAALAALKKYTDLQAVISAETKIKQAEYLSIQYETQKKDQELAFKNQSIELLTSQSDSQRRLQLAMWGGVLLLVIILSLIYRQFNLSKDSNRKLLVRQTEIDQKNEALERLLSEKEWLVQEIHHRVKNNLQIVVSLLESQSAYLQSTEALSAIQDSQNRIYAMSLIHQQLYKTENSASLNMESYLGKLVQYFNDSLNHSRVNIQVELQSIELDVSQAIPVGLILNESITNAIKYAFPIAKPGQQIVIRLRMDEANNVVLVVSDNGVGLPENFSQNSDQWGLGLKLIKGLSEDIGGTCSVYSVNGVRVEVKFTAVVPLGKIAVA